MIDTVKTLCLLSGVSGSEDEVRDYILESAMPYADKIETDAMGNLMIFKRGEMHTDNKIMFAAHMDEVGLIITHIEDDGYLRFSFVGGIDRRVVIGKVVSVGENRVAGVIGIKAYHMVSREEEKNVPKVAEMYIDIGAKNREEAEKIINLGDVAVFDDRAFEFGDGYLKAKAIDDRLGCAVMLKMLESDLPCDAWFVFTTQEEIGTRGAKVAAYSINPEICIVLEGTTAADIIGSSEATEVCRLNGGVVIPFMDGGTIYDSGLYKMATKLAEENNIKWQTKRLIAGGTDAAAIQRSRAGVRTLGIALGLRNLHSPACVANTKDFEPMLELTKLLLNELSKENA